ncbi:Uncharacterised protein [Bordetella pertussis]|nr:Uncharacterised protein [Bordetella pertussis]CFW39382.1 Uncharacterised protein [Bordetella pertussis]
MITASAATASTGTPRSSSYSTRGGATSAVASGRCR